KSSDKEASKEAGHSQGQPSEAKRDRSRNSKSRVKGKIVRLNSYPIPSLTSSSSSSQSFSSSSSSTPTPSRQIDNPPSQSSFYPPPTSSPKPPLPHPSRYIPGTRPAVTEDEIRTSMEWQFGRDHFECPRDHHGCREAGSELGRGRSRGGGGRRGREGKLTNA